MSRCSTRRFPGPADPTGTCRPPSCVYTQRQKLQCSSMRPREESGRACFTRRESCCNRPGRSGWLRGRCGVCVGSHAPRAAQLFRTAHNQPTTHESEN
eukprot:5221557-Prymnesium_polylepis.1